MDSQSLKRGCCAVCAHNLCAKDLRCVAVEKVPLDLLQNDCLPEHTLPQTYDFELCCRAILCWSLDEVYMCCSCHSALICKSPHQPVNSLANFQYYGHQRLPVHVREAFSSASIYDLMLVSRARASQVTHYYTYKPSLTLFWSSEEASQRYNKGNVAVRPQHATELSNLLPPNHDELQDAMCVIFSGQKEIPPILVTKSRVKILIDFLIESNFWYQHSGMVYSQANMDALFDEVDREADVSLPRALAMCHLPTGGQASTEEGFSDRYVEDTHSGPVQISDIVMESVGYTEGDHSAQSREKMKLHALAHVLDRKKFLLSRTGSKFVADDDPGLMSYLFPHLDPWSIGGFNHSGRTVQQHISMKAQVRNLLRQDDSPFRHDPHFAFICWNMIQKREISTNTTFRISSSLQRNLANELRDIAPSLTTLANKWNNSVDEKPCTTQEKRAARILRRLQASTKSLRGSVGYKLCRRNEIRTPALFVTLNPHDLTSSIEADIWSVMSAFERSKMIASRPDAAAIAFDLQIRAFIDIILKYKHGPGVFGHCKAYYGMVEAQGRGTLHCHMLLPQVLHGFQAKMFDWLESIISCELLNDVGCTLPQIAELDEASFEYEFREFLTRLAIECNWHNIRMSEKRGDENCRMRMDGSLKDVTTIDLRRWRARINNYTDLILFLLQSNTDTQFIGSGEAAKAAVFYITEYITKNNLPMHVGLQALDYATKMHEQHFAASEDDSTERKNQNLITKSEISHQQVMSYLVGGGDYYTSHTFETLKWYEFVRAAERIDQGMECTEINDTLSEHDESSLEEEEVTVNVMFNAVEFTSQMEDYALRPTTEREFEDLCLWEFAESTIKERDTEDSDNHGLIAVRPKKRGKKKLLRARFADEHSQHQSHRLRMRGKPVVPVLLGDAIPRPDGAEEDHEKYCRCMMVLFKPWRDLRLLKGDHATWIAAFEEETFTPEITTVIRNINTRTKMILPMVS
ncbi:hypothetical protein P692DRAFT_201841410 [Suillus brevipes Sb2]|nr:hypothetical protein P692DRAFT_201841410 [Suillus brevipes Sb2]